MECQVEHSVVMTVSPERTAVSKAICRSLCCTGAAAPADTHCNQARGVQLRGLWAIVTASICRRSPGVGKGEAAEGVGGLVRVEGGLLSGCSGRCASNARHSAPLRVRLQLQAAQPAGRV